MVKMMCNAASALTESGDMNALKRFGHLDEARLRIYERLAQGGELLEVLALLTEFIEQVRPTFLASISMGRFRARTPAVIFRTPTS